MKDALSRQDVQRLRALDLKPGTLKYNARTIWLFSLYANGMRCEDVLLLQWSDLADGTLTYTAYQTEVRRKIKINRTMRLLLDPYSPRQAASRFVFPYMDLASHSELPTDTDTRLNVVIRQLNSRLRAVQATLGLSAPLTLHNARHTFARFLFEQTGDFERVQAALGHRQPETTRQYLRTIRGLDVPAEDDAPSQSSES